MDCFSLLNYDYIDVTGINTQDFLIHGCLLLYRGPFQETTLSVRLQISPTLNHNLRHERLDQGKIIYMALSRLVKSLLLVYRTLRQRLNRRRRCHSLPQSLLCCLHYSHTSVTIRLPTRVTKIFNYIAAPVRHILSAYVT